MTKRILSGLLVCLLILGVTSPCAAAAVPDTSGEITWFDDGSYLVTVISGNDSRALGSVTKTKTSTYYSASDKALWAVAVTASFTYNNSVAICKSSSGSVTIYDSAWYEISCSTSRNGNSATCNAELGRRVLGVTVTRVPHAVTITCDKDGNVS